MLVGSSVGFGDSVKSSCSRDQDPMIKEVCEMIREPKLKIKVILGPIM